MRKPEIRNFLFFGIFFLLYLMVGILVRKMGFWNLEEVYLVERALLGTKGVSAEFESIGLTYPTFPFVLLFLPVSLGLHLKAGVLFSSMIGVLTLLLFTSLIIRSRVGFLALLFVALHPLFLYAYSGGGGIGFFLFFIFLFIYSHKQFLESDEKDVSALFMSSIFLALSVLVAYEAVLFIFPVVFTLIFDKNPWRSVSKPIVLLFPILFILGGIAYLNWMYKGDEFHFAHSPLLLSAGLFDTDYVSKRVTYENLLFPLLLFPAYVFSVLSMIKQPKLLVLLLSPFIVAVINAWIFGTSLPASYFCLLGGVSLIFLEKNKGLMKQIILIASVAGALLAFVLPGKLMWGGEEKFAQYLTLRREGAMLKGHREMADYLSRLDGKIFFDDTYNYPVVFFHGDPKAFILPYQFEFEFYIRSPHTASDYVLVSNPKRGRDLLSQSNSDIFFERDPRWRLIKEVDGLKLFKFNNPKEK